jgi:hypothetical protein
MVNRLMKTYPSIRFVEHEKNKGKGTVIHTGIKEA